MKQLLLLIYGIFLTLLPANISCKKQHHCDPASKGRIIGFHPCRHYSTSTSNVQGFGFVVEIDNNTSKDTVMTFGIPNGLFQFPDIDSYASANGQFLYATNVQDNLLIKFNYRFAKANEKTAVICTANINTAPFESAVKGKEILISCVTSQ